MLGRIICTCTGAKLPLRSFWDAVASLFIVARVNTTSAASPLAEQILLARLTITLQLFRWKNRLYLLGRIIQLENHLRICKAHSAAKRPQLDLAPATKERGPKVDLRLCNATVLGARFNH